MREHAIITGGSSGIGLAVAKLLSARGIAVSLIARDRDRLAAAQCAVAGAGNGAAPVEVHSADVRDAAELKQAIGAAAASLGVPSWGISSAGIVLPGVFPTQTLGDHENQWRTNYMGSLQFAHFMFPFLAKSQKGKLVLIASGAAFAGIYGYSSYGPTKFAVRGLAESLRIELKPHKVSVTIAFPGDTDTPQWRTELPVRPKVTSQLARGSGVMNPDMVAKGIVTAAERGNFDVTFGWQLRLFNRTHSLIGPLFRRYQDWLVRRSGEVT